MDVILLLKSFDGGLFSSSSQRHLIFRDYVLVFKMFSCSHTKIDIINSKTDHSLHFKLKIKGNIILKMVAELYYFNEKRVFFFYDG